MARPDFRGQAARRLSEERELSPSIISLLSPEGTTKSHGIRNVPVERIDPNPEQPRLTFDPDTLNELAASITEHGVLQPILVRPGRRAATSSSPGAALARIEDRRPRRDPGAHRGDRRRHGDGDRDHREPPTRRPLAARRGADVRAHDVGSRLQRAQARPEAGQGQGLHREPAAPGGRARGDQAARVFAQRHPRRMPTSC